VPRCDGNAVLGEHCSRFGAQCLHRDADLKNLESRGNVFRIRLNKLTRRFLETLGCIVVCKSWNEIDKPLVRFSCTAVVIPICSASYAVGHSSSDFNARFWPSAVGKA
jgi:hypothetical protein